MHDNKNVGHRKVVFSTYLIFFISKKVKMLELIFKISFRQIKDVPHFGKPVEADEDKIKTPIEANDNNNCYEIEFLEFNCS